MATDPHGAEYFQLAATVRHKLRKADPRANTMLNLLEVYVNAAIFQHDRIVRGDRQSKQAFGELWTNLLPSLRDEHLFYSLSDKLWNVNEVIFRDIHFYLVCVDKVEKLHRRFLEIVAPLAEELDNPMEFRQLRKLTQRTLAQAVSQPVKARDFLEHIDKEILEGNFGGLKHEVNASQHTFLYGSQESVMIDTELLKKAYQAVIRMLEHLPDRE